MRISIATFACLAAVPVAAQETYDTDPPAAIELSAGIEAMTDYRFRGISRSDGDPAIRGWGEIHHESGFYGGARLTTVDGPPAFADLELEPYAGWKGSIAPLIDLDLGLTRRQYLGAAAGAGDGYWEGHAAVIGFLGPARLRLGADWAPTQDSLANRDNLYLSADAEVGIPLTPLTLDAHIGHADGALSGQALVATGESGTDWSIGARYAILPALSARLRYVGNDAPSVAGLTDDTVVASLTFSF